MRLEALKHLARVALEMTGPDSDLLVVGSSSLLGSFPELGEESGPLGTRGRARRVEPVTGA